jgi:ABC-type branched-subunit amino acid transport system ATPase component
MERYGLKEDALLAASGLSKSFGRLQAVHQVSFELRRGEVLGLIGPNGAGKTTLLNLLSGFYVPDRGEFYVNGRKANGLPPYEIVRLGVARTFQVPRLFYNLTVEQNIRAALLSSQRSMRRDVVRALELMGLNGHREKLARELSGGQQRLLELAMAWVMDPRIYLLDEPFAGVHPVTRERIVGVIRSELEEEKKSFVVISHEITTLMQISRRVIVMSMGRVVAEGPPEEVSSNREVIEVYLGQEV